MKLTAPSVTVPWARVALKYESLYAFYVWGSPSSLRSLHLLDASFAGYTGNNSRAAHHYNNLMSSAVNQSLGEVCCIQVHLSEAHEKIRVPSTLCQGLTSTCECPAPLHAVLFYTVCKASHPPLISSKTWSLPQSESKCTRVFSSVLFH